MLWLGIGGRDGESFKFSDTSVLLLKSARGAVGPVQTQRYKNENQAVTGVGIKEKNRGRETLEKNGGCTHTCNWKSSRPDCAIYSRLASYSNLRGRGLLGTFTQAETSLSATCAIFSSSLR